MNSGAIFQNIKVVEGKRTTKTKQIKLTSRRQLDFTDDDVVVVDDLDKLL